MTSHSHRSKRLAALAESHAELLAALNDATDSMDDFEGEGWGQFQPLVAKFRAAIARAEAIARKPE